jgi:hypothetical protein
MTFSPSIIATPLSLSSPTATHILIRDSDAHILHSTTTFAPHTRRPQLEFANRQFIVPISFGFITFPDTNVTLRAFIFRDHDLAYNLFGIAPLLRHGYTATFTEHDFALHTPDKILLYGTKAPHSNTWGFSLPRPKDFFWVTILSHILQRSEARMAT